MKKIILGALILAYSLFSLQAKAEIEFGDTPRHVFIIMHDGGETLGRACWITTSLPQEMHGMIGIDLDGDWGSPEVGVSGSVRVFYGVENNKEVIGSILRQNGFMPSWCEKSKTLQ